MAGLLRQRSLSEGLWNGRKGWMAVGAVVWGARGVRWALHREERVLLREVLEPGETVVVREVPRKPPKAKPAKTSKKAEKVEKVEKPAKLSRKDRKAIKRAARDAA